MKILIIGAGSIGTLYGWVLQNAGHEVIHYVRPGKKNALEQRQITIQVRDWRPRRSRPQQRYYRYRAIECLVSADLFDFALIPVDYYHYDDLLPILQKVNENTLFIPFGNHWNDLEAIENVLQGRYLLGFPHHGCFIADNKLYGMLNRSISLAEPDGRHSERLDAIAALFRAAGFKPQFPKDFRGWCYVHFAWNCAMLSQAACCGNIYYYRTNNVAIRDTFLVMREIMQVVRARGVDPMRFREGRMAYAPLWWNVLLTRLMLALPSVARMADWQMRHNKMGIRRQYFDMLYTARNLNVPTPHLEACRGYINAM